MKDSLIRINLEHENETDRQTRRSRQGELCWALKMTESNCNRFRQTALSPGGTAAAVEARPGAGSQIVNLLKWIKCFTPQLELDETLFQI